MTEERNIKTGNTFSVLQKDDLKPILEEQKLHPITKIDEEEIKGRGRGKLGKYLNEKRKSEMEPKSGLQKKHSYKRN